MFRAALALLLLAQIDGGRPTRVPGRTMPLPGLGGIPPTARNERHQGEPIKPGPIPLPSEHRAWVRVETPHFTIFSSASPRITRSVAHDLERITALLIKTSDLFRAPETPTRVFLFADPGDVQPYFDAARNMRVDAAGVTVRDSGGSTILIDVTARGGEALTPRHELVHDLLRNTTRPLPLWLEEGLAEYYSNAGQPIWQHASRLRRARMPIALDELFAMTDQSPRSASWDFYAESWSAAATLLRRDANAFRELVRDLDRGVPMTDTLRDRYHMTPGDLENRMRKAGAPASSILASGVTLNLEPQPLEYPALVFELGVLLAHLPNRQADAERHYRAAQPYLETAPRDRFDVAFALYILSVRDGKLLEAAKILRDLAPRMPENTRRDFEAQAASLEAAESRSAAAKPPL